MVDKYKKMQHYAVKVLLLTQPRCIAVALLLRIAVALLLRIAACVTVALLLHYCVCFQVSDLQNDGSQVHAHRHPIAEWQSKWRSEWQSKRWNER